VAPTWLSAQSVLMGVVREDSTGRVLAGVEIAIEGEKAKTTTDAGGAFAFVLPNGVRIANFRLPGYRPLKMRVTMKGDTGSIIAILNRAWSRSGR
jgi:hypothetical protein